MKQMRIRSILQDALEEEIPSSQVKLWPAVKASLVAGKHPPLQQGGKMNAKPLRRIPRLAFVVSMMVLLVAVALVTPEGRALSENILQLFRRAEGTRLPLQPSGAMTREPNPAAPTARPPAPLISVAEAEAQAGFRAAVLPLVPDGFDYFGARLYGKAIAIEYEARDWGGHLFIMQSQEGFVQSDWDKVPADAIVPVRVGESDGEFAAGTFVVYAGETLATWNPNHPMLRLRWEKDGVWFEMTKFGDGKAIEYLDQAGMIDLAERLTVQP
jgi:hypothetical protein